ncbi:hypothetical protein KR059_012184, partial [Drosophila kikkawai]
MADNIDPPSPTSEVGSPPLQDNPDNGWRTLLEAQSKVIAELLKAAQSTSTPGTRAVSAVLPSFDPEAADADAAAWCKTANMILSEHPQEGASLVMALSKSLHGSASQWLSQICYPGMSWTQFKELFMERYEGNETPAALLLDMLKGRPNPEECLSVYSSR